MPVVSGDTVTWECVYTDGSSVSEADGGRYADIDRRLVDHFRLIEGGQVIAAFSPQDGERRVDLMFRRRTLLGQGGRRVVFLVGFPLDDGGMVTLFDPRTRSSTRLAFDAANPLVAPVAHRAGEFGETPLVVDEWEALLGTTSERLLWKARLEGASYPFDWIDRGSGKNQHNDRSRIIYIATRFDGGESSRSSEKTFWDGVNVDDRPHLDVMRDYAGEMSTSAFYAYAMGDEQVAQEVREAVVRQARDSDARKRVGLDGHSPDKSKYGDAYGTHPWMEISPTLRMWAYAFSWADFLDVFSGNERADVLEFASASAHWSMGHVYQQMNSAADYDGQVWRNGSGDRSGSGNRYWWNGPQQSDLAMNRFNNRHATAVLYIPVAGTLLDDSELIEFYAGWYRSAIRVCTTPFHGLNDYHREFSASSHEQGVRYALNMVGHWNTAADIRARVGDTSLYDYETVDGQGSTVGAPQSPSQLSARSILSAWESASFIPERKLGTIYGKNGTQRLDGVRDNGIAYTEWIFCMQAYNYFRGKFKSGASAGELAALEQLRRMVFLDGNHALDGYPEGHAGNGRNLSEQGEQGTYPGLWLMFADEDPDYYPYPVEAA